jgi:hypothetical protein
MASGVKSMRTTVSAIAFARGIIAALTLAGAALSLGGCGNTGPAGATGATGTAGPAGAAGATGPAGAGVSWVDVTGPAAQALPNSGYMADSTSKVTVTLPTDPAIGDLVEVTGTGPGGWTIAQNAGQQIHVGFENALWNLVGPTQSWTAIVASANGALLAAAASGGAIYTSNDGGATWTAQNSGSEPWSSLASSANGTILLAASNPGQLSVSTNSGQTWTAEGPSLGWSVVSVSPDGTHMVASGSTSSNQPVLYVSANSGATWTQLSTTMTFLSFAWPTATELLAVGVVNVYAGGIYVSADDGANWTQDNLGISNVVSVVSSSDGTHLYALGVSTASMSIDSGAIWTPQGSVPWNYIAMSPDGSVLVGANDLVSLSTDSGQYWTLLTSSGRTFAGFAILNDDQKILGIQAGSAAAPICALPDVTSMGTSGTLSGAQNQTVTLQYDGSGIFRVIGNEGLLVVQ